MKSSTCKNPLTNALPALLATLVAIILLATACSRQADYSGERADYAAEAAADTSYIEAQSQAMLDSSLLQALELKTTDGEARQLIKTAQLSAEVDDVFASIKSAERLTQRYGGFVASQHVQNIVMRSHREKTANGVLTITEHYHPEAQLTARIPKSKLQSYLTDISKLATFITSNSIETQDAVFDLIKAQQIAKLHAATAKQTDTAYASSDEAALVEKTLALDSKALREQSTILANIEAAEIKDKVAFSTVHLSFTQSDLVRTHTEQHFAYVVEQHRASFWYRLEESFEAGWENFINIIVALASLWPFALILPFIWFGLRWLRSTFRKCRQKKSASKKANTKHIKQPNLNTNNKLTDGQSEDLDNE